MSKLKVTQWEQRIVSDLMSIEIDTELLGKCNPAFKGESIEELIEFLNELEQDIDEFTENNEEILGDFGPKLYSFILMENPSTEYYDSSNNGADRSFQDGEEDIDAWEYFIKQNR